MKRRQYNMDIETHKKLKTISAMQGQSMTKALDTIVNYFITQNSSVSFVRNDNDN